MNLKLAFRTLFRTPFVTVVAIVSLALGIGANTAIFSLFDQLLLRPLPVSQPEKLVNLESYGPKPGSNSCGPAGSCEVVWSYPMFRDLEKQQAVFTGIAAHRDFPANVAYHGQTMNTRGLLVSGSYFGVLQVRPALGRLIMPDDDRVIGANPLVVLSYDYWRNQLGGDPKVIGEKMVINGQPMTVIGVAPEGFSGTTISRLPAVFVPITMRAQMSPGWKGFENRQSYWIYLFARLKPGMNRERAQTALNTLFQPIIREVEAPLQKGMSDKTMERFKARTVTLAEGSRGQSSVPKEAKTPLLLLFSITGIVLLIACANIANLLLARSAGRSLEMAVRLSLGASRRQLLTQLLTESLVLAALGGIVSILVARWTLSVIGAILPSDASLDVQLTLQLPIVLFTAGLAVGTGLLFGLFPALQSTRPDLVTTIRSNTGTLSGARAAARFRTSLVTAQIALSMTLLISAGLFIKSLRNVSRTELGVRTENVVTFALSPELNGYPNAKSGALFRTVEEELNNLPGVTGATAAIVPLLSGDNWGNSVKVQGFKDGPDVDNNSRVNLVGPGFFRVMGVPVLAGREFTTADIIGAQKVAIVNEAFAKKFGLGRDAVGKLMSQGDKDLNMLIVGLVKDAKYSEVKDAIPPVYFMPYRQDSTVGGMTFYARTANDPIQTLRAVPAIVKKLDPDLPVETLKLLRQQAQENVFLDRMISMLSAAFAALATLLAAVGLYGVLAYTVTRRTREIGVRMALGADATRVRLMVLRQVGVMTLIGGVVGIGVAIALGRAARSLLFELQAHDPLVIATAVVVLTLVSLAAGFVPAYRASQVDPMQALRYE